VRRAAGLVLLLAGLAPGASGQDLKSLLPNPPYFIPKESVSRIREKLGLSTDQLLGALVPIAQGLARPPISNYHAGAAALGASGAIYLGVNLEFPGSQLSQTVHCEHFAVVNALAHGERALKKMALSAPSCGHCRQFLYELNAIPEILIPGRPAVPLTHYLPEPFGPRELGKEKLLLDPVDHGLVLAAAPKALAAAALAAANAAYAPYSGDPSGVALRTKDGKIYAGSAVESVAFNPSLPPLQAAFVVLLSAGRSYADIADAALVQKRGAKADHAEVTRAVLKSVAPDAGLVELAAEAP